MPDPLLQRAAAGDPGAFIDLLARYHDSLRVLAADDRELLAGYVAAYRVLADYSGEPPLERWLAGFVESAVGSGTGAALRLDDRDFWARLREALAAESPAFAAPELPESRFPVIPRLQSRRRGKGRRP